MALQSEAVYFGSVMDSPNFNAPFHCFEQVIIFNNVSKCSVEWKTRSLFRK